MERVRALQRVLSERGEAAALITSPENIRYFTGFYVWNALTPFALAVVPAAGEPLLLVPRADESLARTVSRWAVEPYDPGPGGFRTTADLAHRALARADVAGGVLGLEFGAVPLDRARLLEETLSQFRLSDIAGALTDLRLIKDREEQSAFRCAAALVASAMRQTALKVRPGISEIEVKAAMDLAVCTEGARRWPDAIVQSQTNVVSGAKLNRLHDAATGRSAGPGEMVFVMGGASVNGYWANIGRTLFVYGGSPSGEARLGLDVAAAAQRAAVERLHPGAPLGEAVRAADVVLGAAGLADRKTYPIFRGLGLRIDERPRAVDLDLILRPGMCLCAQLYLRLPEFIVGRSDSVLITTDGAEVVSDPAGEG
ncbi:MAG TPA: Xaa-Pro peptidase family protein [bacterium]|nr:Xaa-Pro peptidase family protein [bacterium]